MTAGDSLLHIVQRGLAKPYRMRYAVSQVPG